VGSNLVDAKTVADQNWTVIEDRAHELIQAVRAAREA